MDEIRQLEQEINALQAQLRRQSEEAARARQALMDENRRKLQAYEADLRSTLSSHDSTTQAEYEKLLAEYQRSISSDVQLELARMDASYNQLLNDVKRSEAALLQKNQELEQAIAAIRNDVSKRNQGSGQEAKTYLENATVIFHTVEAKPHEKFMPKRLQIFFNAIKDGQQLFKAGLYEAATAVAISAKAGLERLGYTIDDKVAEWDRQYDLFSMKLIYLQAKAQQELTDWEEYIGEQSGDDANKRKLHLIEINYWSRGVFATIVQGAKKYQHIVNKVNEAGKDAYLKQPDSASTDNLKEYISDLEDLDKQLSELSSLYKQRYSASCERSDWGDAIIDFLTGEINLIWHEGLTGYKEASLDARNAKDFVEYIRSHYGDSSITEDTREWLKLVFENASENQIYIYILPIEVHGRVENRIIIHVDYGGPDQELYSRDIYQHVCEAIDYTEDSDGVVNYASDVNELKLSENKVFSETGKDIERMQRRSRDDNKEMGT